MAIRSERMTQTLRVMREVKDELYSRCSSGNHDVTREDFDSIVDEKIKKVARDLNISESTCVDKMTRQLNLNKEEFKDAFFDLLVGSTPAVETKLGGLILTKKTTADSCKDIEDALISIKGAVGK